MSIIIERFDKIKSNISNLKPTQEVKIVAVSKTFPLSHIRPLIDYGHTHFGENKVQEAKSKWSDLKKSNKKGCLANQINNNKMPILEELKKTVTEIKTVTNN